MLVAPGISNTHTPNYVNPPTRTAELLAVQIPLMSLALVFVALRMASRYYSIRSPGWDDFVLTIATVRSPLLYQTIVDQRAQVLALAQTILVLSCIPHGAAMHVWDIPPHVNMSYILKVDRFLWTA